MKKVLFSLLGILLITNLTIAQEDAAKLAKQAGKALTSYNMDSKGNKAKLDEAIQKIEEALKSPEVQADAGAWITKGDIFYKRLEVDATMRMLDPKAPFTGDNDALVAFEAYKKALETPTAKKFEKSDAIKGIKMCQGHLINMGAAKFEKAEYDKTFKSFEASLMAHDILKANKEESVLSDDVKYEEQMFYTAIAAQSANMTAESAKYYEILYKNKSVRPTVYEGLYSAKMAAGDKEGAKKILEEGRAKFPEESSLLFAEINAYLADGKLNELTDRLKQAIKQEPGNVGLYVTLGNVFDNLYQISMKDKKTDEANTYFEEAKSYYTQATQKDPKNVDAYYATGALYYNKAALKVAELNALPEDYTSAGTKRFNDMKKEMMDLFDLALPSFQKAESLDPNDKNTLIALNEIYARKEDEVSLEFKKRLNIINEGGKNPSSYYKQ